MFRELSAATSPERLPPSPRHRQVDRDDDPDSAQSLHAVFLANAGITHAACAAASAFARDQVAVTDSNASYVSVTFDVLRSAFAAIRRAGGLPTGERGTCVVVGSGGGGAVFAAALLHAFELCVGLEPLHALHALAQRALSAWGSTRSRGSVVAFACCDARRVDWASPGALHALAAPARGRARGSPRSGDGKGSGAATTVLVLHAACWSEGDMLALARVAEACAVGSWAVTLTRRLPALSWHLVHEAVCGGSGAGDRRVTLYVARKSA